MSQLRPGSVLAATGATSLMLAGHLVLRRQWGRPDAVGACCPGSVGGTGPPGLGESPDVGHMHCPFALDLCHELRSPLAALRAELEVAGMDPGQADLHALLGASLRAVGRMEAVITDLLEFARRQQDAPEPSEPVDLAVLVAAEVADRSDRLPVTLRLDEGVSVHAVRELICRVLINLLDNAQRHARQAVEVRVRRDGDTAELAVGDDGAGVAAADRRRIFERFTRLEEARRLDGRGSGLGLAIAHDIVRAHGGGVHVTRSPAGGALFVVRLPAVPPGR
ncbi:sensor histidine kinase [Sphaerisporangium rufum]|nr:HAMP domain-containing sensor histidine kinase [Sphaerisporangium rufum]